MRQCMDFEDLHARLQEVVSQIQDIDQMIDQDIPCEEILTQINTSKAALHKAGQVILEGHIRHCVRQGIENGDAEKTIHDFTNAVGRFANMK